jgi:uncharacterized membrane protein YgdD (TMEM256/DUF423 family)
MPRTFFILGSMSGFLSVALGAFGAHSLKETLSPEMLGIFETGVRYQFYHSIALFLVGFISAKFSHSVFSKAGWFFVAGILLFSGSLYLLAISGVGWVGAITPFGGVAFLAGWAFLAWGFWQVER